VELDSLRWVRRAASAAVSLSAIALVMARTQGPSEAGGAAVGLVAAMGFCGSLIVLVVAWRKEHALNEAAFAERERQQLVALRLQMELAKQRGPEGAKNAAGEKAKPS
jgi:hypothetical protein